MFIYTLCMEKQYKRKICQMPLAQPQSKDNFYVFIPATAVATNIMIVRPWSLYQNIFINIHLSQGWTD